MLIGSKALKHWFPDLPRQPADEDHMLAGGSVKGIDGHACPAFDLILAKYRGAEIAPPVLLYTLKLSHSFWPVHWEKTLFDIAFMQRHGANQVDEEAYSWLYAQWETVHGPKRGVLAKDNDSFFADGVERLYDHDDLHRIVAYYDEPLFERLKDDQTSAACSFNRFMALSPLDRIRCVHEEVYVIALERFLIPGRIHGPKTAYRAALKLLVTSLWRGRWARFIVENWLDIRGQSMQPYLDRFNQAKPALCRP